MYHRTELVNQIDPEGTLESKLQNPRGASGSEAHDLAEVKILIAAA